MGTAVTTKTAHPLQQALLDSKGELNALLKPKGIELKQIWSELYFAAEKNPDILNAEPHSVVAAIARIIQWDLVVGDTAHLLIFGRKATPVADYRGLIELVVRSGAARSVTAKCVYEGEPFEYKETAYGPELHHEPSKTSIGKCPIVGAYCLIRETQSISRVTYMAKAEIDAIRMQYSKSWKKGTLEENAWYAAKTVVRQAIKLLPKNQKLAGVLRVVDEEDRLLAADVTEAMQADHGPERPQLAAPGMEVFDAE